MSTALNLLAVLVLVLANGFFVAAEFALVSVRRTRIDELAEQGDRLAMQVRKAHANLDRSISGTQLGITLASLGLGWIGEPALAHLIEDAFVGLGAPWSAVATHGTAIAIAFATITFLHIVLGELAPKSAALMRPETISRYVAGPLNLFNFIVAPFIYVLNGAAQLLLRAVGAGTLGTHGRVHSPEEIRMLLGQSRAEGIVELDEEAMIHGVFELTHTVAREVMTPRPDIIAFQSDTPLDQVLATAADTGFSRFPVYRGSIDDVIGIVLVKDLLRWVRVPREGEASSREGGQFRLDRVVRAPFFVPDSKPVDDLLAELRHQKVHMAVVVDEFGGTDGVVTLEDLVEEIVGDIFDEHDVARPEIEILGGGRVRVEGGASLEDLLDEFDLGDVEASDEYDTVAGYVIGHLGRIPSTGDRVPIGRAELEVIETLDQRVTRLELRLDGGAASATSEPVLDGERDLR